MIELASRHRLLLIGSACALLASCGSTVPPSKRAELGLEERLREQGIEPSSIVDPVELSAEMKEWVHAKVRPGLSEGERLDELMRALTDKKGLAVQYERDFTGTARQVFESGEANCLSFTNLFIGLAREIGVSAYYLNVRRDVRYAQEGNLVVRWEHVTAGWNRGTERKVLEFGFVPESDYRTAVRLSDTTALAMFYSNRGAETLLAGDLERALDWLETAVTIDPTWSHAWLNLGVVRRRLGDDRGAEEAYRQGLEEDEDHLQLYANLAALLQSKGDTDSAGELLRLLDQKANRNPFIYRSLGDTALREGRLDDARRYYRRALHLNAQDADTQAAMGLWELASQNLDRARSRLERAEKLDPSSERAAQLRARLEERGEQPVVESGNLVRFEPDGRQGRIFE